MRAATPLPKYHQIYLVLREQLAEGRYRDGLPAELRLVEQFGVARATVRRAPRFSPSTGWSTTSTTVRCSGCRACTGPIVTGIRCSCRVWAASPPRSG